MENYEKFRIAQAQGEHLSFNKKLKIDTEAENKGCTIYDYSKWYAQEKFEAIIVFTMLLLLSLTMFFVGFYQGVITSLI